MVKLKDITFLVSSSLLMVCSSFAQNNSATPSELNNILSSQQGANATSEVIAQQVPKSVNNLGKNGKPLNTPAATEGTDYDSKIVTGLDEYNNRKKMLAERAAEIQKEKEKIEEEFRRQAYEKALLAAQERERSRIAASAGKKMSNQDYFDKQTKILQGQK